MERNGFITKYTALGERLEKWLGGDTPWPQLEEAVRRSAEDNAFFTPYMQRRALEAMAGAFLREEELRRWLGQYPEPLPGAGTDTCGIVAAGNIPAVGFHDILTVLAAGWSPLVKLSSKDRHLLPVLFPPDSGVRFSSSTDGWEVDALLTMGGDTAAEFYRNHFNGIPKVVRSGKFSVAAVTGREDNAGLGALAEDMLLYYGLGCRSATCLLVPEGYDFSGIMQAAGRFAAEYWGRPGKDNYRKNKAVLTLAGESFLDCGTVIFRNLRALIPGAEDDIGLCRAWGIPLHVGEVWYVEYASKEEMEKFIRVNMSRIQKIIRNFGHAQRPALDDWPDGTDTLGLLIEKQLKNHDTQIQSNYPRQ